MNQKKRLLVTFPVDLGNRTIESNLQNLFVDEMDFFRFAAQSAEKIDTKNSYGGSVRNRLFSIHALRKQLQKYSGKDNTILFNGLSPAFLSYGAWQPENTALVFDWTRLLYPATLGHDLKKDIVFKMHRNVLKNIPKILCWTDAIANNLQEHYSVSSSQIYKVPAPFLVEKLDIYPRPTPKIPRVLFIGGDLKRKGGDVLLNNCKLLSKHCELTMVTNDSSANIDGINFMPNVRYGTPTHKKIFEQNDILILPTRIDAYPQVIGEAAAAGLAVITTKFALGAHEVIADEVSGYVCNSPEESVSKLLSLVTDLELIDKFKMAGYEIMHKKFSRKSIVDSYISVL